MAGGEVHRRLKRRPPFHRPRAKAGRLPEGEHKRKTKICKPAGPPEEARCGVDGAAADDGLGQARVSASSFSEGEEETSAQSGFASDDSASPLEGSSRQHSTISWVGNGEGQRQTSASLFCGVPFAEWEVLLHPRLRRTLAFHNFSHPTSIQQLAIATALHGHDTLIQSFTGSGKTLCMAVPLIQKVLLLSQRRRLERREGTRALWISPTRELATQAAADVQRLCNLFPWLTVAAITGGAKRQSEKRQLRGGVGVLVVTPGRLLDHLRFTSSLALRPLQALVLDEADRLLESGYEQQVRSAVFAVASRISEEEALRRLREEGHATLQSDAASPDAPSSRGALDASPDSDDEAAQREELRRREKTHEEKTLSPRDSQRGTPSATPLPEGVQVIMASATLTPAVKRLAEFCLRRSPQWVTQKPLALLDTRMHEALTLLSSQRRQDSGEVQAEPTERPSSSASSEALLEEEAALREKMLLRLCQCSLPCDLRGVACSAEEKRRSLSSATSNSKAKAKASEEGRGALEGRSAGEEEVLSHVHSLPAQLEQHFLLIDPRLRLLPLVAFLLKLEDSRSKAVLFASSCEVIDFLWLLLRRLRWPRRPPGDRVQRQRLLDLQRHVKEFKLQQKEQRLHLKKVQETIGREKKRRRKAALLGGVPRSDGAALSLDGSEEEDQVSSDEEEEDDDLEGEPPGFWGERVFDALSVFKLHGRMSRDDRIGCMEEFSALSGEGGVLLATDVAARGLNIPEVEWVLQLEAPQDVAVYVHRVGRTARLGRRGRSLIFLMDFEKEYVAFLGDRGLKLAAAPVLPLLESLVARSPSFVGELRGKALRAEAEEEKLGGLGSLEPCLRFLQSALCDFVAPRRRLREAASKAFVASISAYKTHSRETAHIFDVKRLPFGPLATSLGLKDTPKQIAASVRNAREAAQAQSEKQSFPKTASAKQRQRQSQGGAREGPFKKPRGAATGPSRKRARKARASEKDEESVIEEVSRSGAAPARAHSLSSASAVQRAASLLKARGEVMETTAAKKKKKLHRDRLRG